MTPDEQLELFAQYNEDQLFTAALQLMRRIFDAVVEGGEERRSTATFPTLSTT